MASAEYVRSLLLVVLFGAMGTGCATTGGPDDPLRNTKKLAAEGHASLYKNGAFQVPHTSISLIPPGPSTMEFVYELAGVRGRQSFELSVKKASESIYVVSEGTRLTYRVAKNMSSETNNAADAIRKYSRENSTLIVYRSSELGKNIIGGSWDLSNEAFLAGQRQGRAIIAGSRALGDQVSEQGTAQGMGLASGSVQAAQDIVHAGSATGDKISAAGTSQGMGMAKGSIPAARGVVNATTEGGDKISEAGTRQGMELAAGSLRAAGNLSAASRDRSAAALTYAGNAFVLGYAAVPANMKKRAEEMGDSLDDAKFVDIVKEENERRRELTQPTVDLMSETVGNYTTNVSESFRKAGKELTSSKTTGLSFAVLRSLRWVLQGVLWDATIEPLTKMTAASVGYIGVNYLAFPSMVVVREGVSTTRLAVEVTWNTAKGGYDLVAPTGIAAVAGVYGLLDFTGSHAIAGATAVGGTAAGVVEAGASKAAGVAVKGAGYAAAGATAVAGTVAGVAETGVSKTVGAAVKAASYPVAGATAAVGTIAGVGEAGLSKVSSIVIKGGGYAAGKGVQYIGVPLVSAGIVVGGGTIGTAVGGVGVASGGTLFVAGEAGSATAQVFGNTIAGTTLVGGTAVSTAGGAAYGVYELSKAVIVPTGYEVGSGIVLSYGTLSHLSAHAILAVSDCSYMVLSLEGPRWVLYAIKGKTGNGEDLPVGAVVDLKKMQESGEEIYYLPVPDDKMKEVVSSVYDNLPELKPAGNGEVF
ncbi:MAG: hypothetical protein A2X58_10400 [Nitrospirae bacterium GWC2_56_14]|nr:MAG: hypothetical protein A2X58_10400 [Nitrospirae bacterium GWC2_56_14]